MTTYVTVPGLALVPTLFLSSLTLSSPHCAILFSHCSMTSKVDARPDDFPVPLHIHLVATLKCAIYLILREFFVPN